MRTAAICDMSLTHEIDGSEEEGNTPRVKRTRRGFPRPTFNASSVCALRCSGVVNSCVYVRSRAIPLLIIFRKNWLQETIWISFGWAVYPILSV